MEVGGNLTSFGVLCGLLPNCCLAAVCSFVEMAGKDEPNVTRVVAISLQEKAREGESEQEGCVWTAGRKREGKKKASGSKGWWFGGVGRSFPNRPAARKAQPCQRAGCRHAAAAAPLHWLLSWATLGGVAFRAAAAHEYAICCYICSRPVIPLQPCGYVAFHFADKACQNGFKSEVKAFLI